MEELVSIIICTYNRKKLVTRAIDSAFEQLGCLFEIIVVDDCSDDGSIEYLTNYYKQRINLLSTKQNSGRAVASNLGFKSSKGEYIALLDDDDYWIDPYKLKKQVELMRTNPSLGVLGTWWIELKTNGLNHEKKPIPPRTRYFLTERLLMGGGVVSGSSPLIARSAWDIVGGMDVKQIKGIDSDLYRRIVLAGYSLDVLPQVTTIADADHGFCRMTPTNSTSSKRKQLIANIQVLSKHFLLYLLYPRALVVRLFSIFRALSNYLLR